MSFAQTLDLVDDPARIAEYVAYHERVWPEVLDGLRSIGISDMRIFLAGNRLFMTYTAPDDFDPTRDYQTYSQDPRVAEWDALMRTYQQRVPFAETLDDPGEWWTPMRTIFDLSSAG